MTAQIKWDNVSIRVDKWKRLQALCEELEPHEHYDGMNECSICDEPLTDVLIRHCESLLALRKAPAATISEGVVRDALRYRWFRDADLHPANWDAETCELVLAELDAAIDTAMLKAAHKEQP